MTSRNALVRVVAVAASVVSLTLPVGLAAPAMPDGGVPAADVVIEIPLDRGPSSPATAPVPEPAAAPAVADEPREPDLVRVWHVLGFDPFASNLEGFDLGGQCPRASTCDVHALSPGRWTAGDDGTVAIGFAYNDAGRPRGVTAAATHAAFSAATAEWSAWNPMISFVDEGTTDATFAAAGADGTCADGTNVVGWGAFDRDVVGVAAMCFDRANGVMREADLALNLRHRWATADHGDGRFAGFDVQSVVTHELGHWLSLVDLYIGIDAGRQTMFGSVKPGTTHQRTLALGDVVGVQRAYPCGDVCPDTSAVVDD